MGSCGGVVLSRPPRVPLPCWTRCFQPLSITGWPLPSSSAHNKTRTGARANGGGAPTPWPQQRTRRAAQARGTRSPPHGRRFEIKRPRALAHCCNRADRRAASTGKCGCIQRPPCGIKGVSRTPTLAGDAGSTQPIVQLASPRGPVASPVHRRPTRGVKRRSPCTGLASKPPSSAPRRRHRAAPPPLARRGAPAGTRRVTPIHRRRASAARLGRVGAWAKGLAAHVRAGPERDSLAPAVWRGGCAAGARCRLPLAAGV